MTSQVSILQNRINEQDERIERLEAAVHGLTAIETTKALGSRVEELEAMLHDVVRCLIDGETSADGSRSEITLHSHRILGTESVQVVVEIYHRLKAQMGDPGYDTP